MKRILITGISGYLGNRLAESLAGRDEVGLIVGADIAPMKKEYRNVVFHKTDIRSPEIAKIMKDNQIDTVLHLAFVVKPIHNKKRMHDIDVNGTRNVLEGALSSGVKHVVAISSTLAYGAHRDNPLELTEDHPLRGNESYPYGHNKALVDVMMQEFAKNHPEMTITILRPCTVFGPSVDNYVSRMLFMPVVVSIIGYDPDVQLVHEDDFVNACLCAMDKKIPGAFNIAGDGALCTSAIASMIGTAVIPPSQVDHLSSPRGVMEAPHAGHRGEPRLSRLHTLPLCREHAQGQTRAWIQTGAYRPRNARSNNTQQEKKGIIRHIRRNALFDFYSALEQGIRILELCKGMHYLTPGNRLQKNLAV